MEMERVDVVVVGEETDIVVRICDNNLFGRVNETGGKKIGLPGSNAMNPKPLLQSNQRTIPYDVGPLRGKMRNSPFSSK